MRVVFPLGPVVADVHDAAHSVSVPGRKTARIEVDGFNGVVVKGAVRAVVVGKMKRLQQFDPILEDQQFKLLQVQVHYKQVYLLEQL